MPNYKAKGGKKRPNHRGTRAEIEKRILYIVNLIEVGITTFSEITKYCRAPETETKPWRVTSTQTICNYIAQAWEIIRTEVIADTKKIHALQMRRYGKHYRRAVGAEARTVKVEDLPEMQKVFINDETRAINILSRMDRINGLEISKQEITGKDGGPIQIAGLSDEELLKKIEEYEHRHNIKKP